MAANCEIKYQLLQQENLVQNHVVYLGEQHQGPMKAPYTMTGDLIFTSHIEFLFWMIFFNNFIVKKKNHYCHNNNYYYHILKVRKLTPKQVNIEKQLIN